MQRATQGMYIVDVIGPSPSTFYRRIFDAKRDAVAFFDMVRKVRGRDVIMEYHGRDCDVVLVADQQSDNTGE